MQQACNVQWAINVPWQWGLGLIEHILRITIIIRDCLAWKGQPDLCLERLQQHEVLKASLGPLYLFYFATSCFSLMFFSFNIYIGFSSLDYFGAGAIAYGVLALGK